MNRSTRVKKRKSSKGALQHRSIFGFNLSPLSSPLSKPVESCRCLQRACNQVLKKIYFLYILYIKTDSNNLILKSSFRMLSNVNTLFSLFFFFITISFFMFLNVSKMIEHWSFQTTKDSSYKTQILLIIHDDIYCIGCMMCKAVYLVSPGRCRSYEDG